ncbi:hypothetical protein HK098_006672 [Nowakowskiella sp. JEL0407]|nr:hypothetical protein HK098_006672 [Nowakowskiella sp. JEL0407]
MSTITHPLPPPPPKESKEASSNTSTAHEREDKYALSYRGERLRPYEYPRDRDLDFYRYPEYDRYRDFQLPSRGYPYRRPSYPRHHSPPRGNWYRYDPLDYPDRYKDRRQYSRSPSPINSRSPPPNYPPPPRKDYEPARSRDFETGSNYSRRSWNYQHSPLRDSPPPLPPPSHYPRPRNLSPRYNSWGRHYSRSRSPPMRYPNEHEYRDDYLDYDAEKKHTRTMSYEKKIPLPPTSSISQIEKPKEPEVKGESNITKTPADSGPEQKSSSSTVPEKKPTQPPSDPDYKQSKSPMPYEKRYSNSYREKTPIEAEKRDQRDLDSKPYPPPMYRDYADRDRRYRGFEYDRYPSSSDYDKPYSGPPGHYQKRYLNGPPPPHNNEIRYQSHHPHALDKRYSQSDYPPERNYSSSGPPPNLSEQNDNRHGSSDMDRRYSGNQMNPLVRQPRSIPVQRPRVIDWSKVPESLRVTYTEVEDPETARWGPECKRLGIEELSQQAELRKAEFDVSIAVYEVEKFESQLRMLENQIAELDESILLLQSEAKLDGIKD